MRLWKAIVALLFVAALVSSAHSVRVEETPLLDEWSDVAGVPAGKTEGGKTPTPLPGESRTSTPAPTPTPAPTGAVEGGSVSSSGTEEYLDKSFDWRFGGREWSLSLGIPEDAYRYYRDKPRPRTGDYSVYVTDPVDDEMVGNLAESFGRRADEEGLSEFERVSFVTAFVQSLPYTPDNVTTDFDEYPRYPVETLVDDGGDCEDSSILLASVMDAMGYDVVLLELPGHMAVGVAGDETVGGSYVEGGGTRYFYVETTGENWEIGELPAEFEELPITIRGLEPVPVLVHSWSATSRGTRVDVNVTVNNVGTDVAEDVRVRCYFQTAEGSYGERISDALTLQPGSSGMYRFTLSAPRDGETRLFVEVLMEGSKVDESRSEPF